MAQLIGTKVNGDLEVTGGLTLASPLEITNGGTGATTRESALSNLLGYIPSGIKLEKTGDNVTTSTSNQYFYPTYGSDWSTTMEFGSHLSSVYQSVTWNNRTLSNTCIKVADDAPSGYILVYGSVRYLKNTSTNGAVQTAIVRLRDGAVSTMSWVVGYYGNERITHTLNQLIYVEPGDIILLGGFKGTASHDVDVISGVSTSWGAIWMY